MFNVKTITSTCIVVITAACAGETGSTETGTTEVSAQMLSECTMGTMPHYACIAELFDRDGNVLSGYSGLQVDVDFVYDQETNACWLRGRGDLGFRQPVMGSADAEYAGAARYDWSGNVDHFTWQVDEGGGYRIDCVAQTE